MEIRTGNYRLCFEKEGVSIRKNEDVLYYNRRPIYAFIKTNMAVTEFFDKAYDTTSMDEKGRAVCEGNLETPNGSKLGFKDVYEVVSEGVSIRRVVKVIKKGKDDLGFASKISFVLADADTIRDYECFAPATWYRDNEYARPYVIGFDPECEYHLRKRDCAYTSSFCSKQ